MRWEQNEVIGCCGLMGTSSGDLGGQEIPLIGRDFLLLLVLAMVQEVEVNLPNIPKIKTKRVCLYFYFKQ